MDKIQIGNCTLGTIPRIVVVIDRIMSLSDIQQCKDNGADILEIRVDCFVNPFEEVKEFVKSIQSTLSIPMIGTIRETNVNKEKRLKLFEALAPLVDAVDIEIDASIQKKVVELYKEKTVIISEHDYEKMPTEAQLLAMVETAKQGGADIVKIAALAKKREEVTRMLKCAEESSLPTVMIAMGDVGSISRVVAPLFGSLFTYAFVNDSVAPGQFSLEQMKNMISHLYPQ